MRKNLFCLLPFLTLSLTSCNVGYDSFKEQAEKACEKEHPFTSGGALVTGSFVDDSKTFNINEDFALSYSSTSKLWSISDTSLNLVSIESLFAGALVTSLVNNKATDYLKEEEEGVKYYSTFGQLKMVEENDDSYTAISFNKYGMIKECKAKSNLKTDYNLDVVLEFEYRK